MGPGNASFHYVLPVCHLAVAINAHKSSLETYRLTCTAHQTDNLTDSMSVDLVCFTTVMTEPTCVDFVAARRLKHP